MTWLVFGVSCLLVLAGAVSIISGAPIIQLERGWAEVISGTVALSSGGVVFALAAVLVRLENLREAWAALAVPPLRTPEAAAAADARKPAEPPAKPVREAAPPPPAASSAVPPAIPLDVAAPEHPAPVAEAEQGLWKRIRRPAEQPDKAALEERGFPDRILPEAAPLAGTPGAAAVIVPTHTPAAVPADAIDPPKPGDAGQIGWLERSLAKGRPGRSGSGEPTVASPAPQPIGGAVPDLAPASGGRVEPSLGMAPILRAAPDPQVEPRSTPSDDYPASQAEPADGVTIVGRYQAGTSSYVMYSDGTIEVETEDGQIHRFGSMDELKAYIASHDTAAT